MNNDNNATDEIEESRLNRRQFILKTAHATGALILGIPLLVQAGNNLKDIQKQDSLFQTYYFKITPDNQYTLIMDKSDMGQGTTTLFTTLFGEEADIPPYRITIETAGVNNFYGTMMGLQITGGSTTTPDRFTVIREAGAFLRAAMVQGAAKRWAVPSTEISVSEGVVSHKTSNKSARYGELIAEAEQQKIKKLSLKTKAQWQYIRKSGKSYDAQIKATGQA